MTVNENSGTATVIVTLSSPSAATVTFDWSMSAGTALANVDYTDSSGTAVTIAAGSTSAAINIPILNDNLTENDETFSVLISNPVNATIADNTALVTIVDDDPMPALQFAAASQAVNEAAGSVSATVILSHPSSFAITATYTVGGTASGSVDHDLTSGTVTFTPGQTSSNIVFNLINDAVDEPNETITLTLGTPSSATLGTPATHTLTIIDDDIAPYTWIGATGDGNWNSPGNWAGGAIPSGSQIAKFDDSCTGANCNVNINSNVTVSGMKLMSSYTGTVTLNGSYTLTLNNPVDSYIQDGGSFVANGPSNILVNGNFTLDGGSFTSSSAELKLKGDFIVGAGGTFNPNGGSVVFYRASTSHAITVASPLDLAWVTFETPSAATGSISLNGTLRAHENLVFNGYGNLSQVNGGTIEALANISASGSGFTGTTLIKIAGSVNQMMSVNAANAALPSVEIVSTGGTVTIGGSYPLRLSRGLTYTSGVVSIPQTVTFAAEPSAIVTLATGPSMVFSNVVFGGNGSETYVLSSEMRILGHLTFNSSSTDFDVNGSVLKVGGDITYSGQGAVGTAQLELNGSTDQTITAVNANVLRGTHTINKASGTVLLASNLSLMGSGQDLILSAGGLDLAGFVLNIADTLNLNSGTSVTLTGGTLNVNGSPVSAGTYGSGTIAP